MDNQTVTPEEKEIALSLLREVAYDNGFFDRWHPEKFASKWIKKVGMIGKMFFDENPDLLTDDNISLLCAGEQMEMQEVFGNRSYFKELHEALNDYFENH